jgi:hypothetical protein
MMNKKDWWDWLQARLQRNGRFSRKEVIKLSATTFARVDNCPRRHLSKYRLNPTYINPGVHLLHRLLCIEVFVALGIRLVGILAFYGEAFKIEAFELCDINPCRQRAIRHLSNRHMCKEASPTSGINPVGHFSICSTDI